MLIKMKGIILYFSKYGATKKYVDWLSKSTNFDVVPVKKAKKSHIKDYDVIILGSGIYASGIKGVKFLRKHAKLLSDKKILIFCVGASPFDEKAFQTLKDHNLKDDLKHIPCFYLRGAWNMDKMTFIDRTLCKLLFKMLAKKEKDKLEVWEKALLAAGNRVVDWTNERYLAPITKYLANLNQ